MDVVRAATVVLGFGFIAVLVLAWYHGEQGRQHVSGLELLMLSGVLLLGGVAVWCRVVSWSRELRSALVARYSAPTVMGTW